jgi:hypothetical protein
LDSAELQQRIGRLAQEHPDEHPYTLALRIQAETGRIMSGRQIKLLLKKLSPI